jgi:DNA-binding response OmpR family regulator
MDVADVAIVRWPTEEQRRLNLRDAGVPRLLLVEVGPPPVPVDVLEDWIRVPAEDVDLAARVEGLSRRATARRTALPSLDGDGVLRVDDRWVSLPPVESRLTGALLERLGAVVSRDALARAGWPYGAPGRNALDVHILRLRRRLGPLRLVIRTVRSRGYMLELASANGNGRAYP